MPKHTLTVLTYDHEQYSYEPDECETAIDYIVTDLLVLPDDAADLIMHCLRLSETVVLTLKTTS